MKKIKDLITKIFSTIGDCLLPTLPILIGVGMLKVVLILLSPTVLGLLDESSDTYRVLQFVADAGYYFMPIFVAFSSSEVFKTNKYIAALVGAMLIHPTFVSIVEKGESISIFGLPIALTNYGNQVISSLIAVWIMSYIYKFLDKITTKNLRPLLVPLLTIVIMAPISFCLIGPLGVLLGNGLVKLILLLKSIGPLGNAIMCAIIPFITVMGLGGANLSAMLLLASTGCDPILFVSNVLYNNILGVVTFALYLKDHKPEKLAASIASAIAGTSEPAIFGFVIKDFKALFALVVGDFLAGLYIGITGVKAYAMASFGIFGIITTIGPDSSIVNAIIGLLIGCISAFIITYLTHKKDIYN